MGKDRCGNVKMIQAIDLFSGAGGLSLGLKTAGWKVEAAVEFDRSALLTHEANFSGLQHIGDDIRNVCFKKFRDIDLVAGGPPCQPFSVSGKRLGSFDVRDMVPEFVRVVDQVRPKAFLMENVAGLKAAKFNAYLEERVRELYELGYVVFSRVLTASDYGVPQNRQRLFLVGIRADAHRQMFAYPDATHGPGTPNKHVTVRQALKGTPYDTPNNARVVYCKNPVLRASPFAGMMFNGKGRPLNYDGVSHTIPASAGGNRTHIVDPLGVITEYHSELRAGKSPRKGELTEVRRLTVRESARLQSFPDNFEFTGRQSSRYSQVGNAVPPQLAKAVAECVARAIA
jgi:DNA (cytosine-5)-methyltransferase 1